MKTRIDKEILRSLLSDVDEDDKGNFNAKCPWCDHKSFGISFKKIFHPFNCYRKKRCGVSGNIFDLLRFIERMDLVEETINIDGDAVKIDTRNVQNENNDFLIINVIQGAPEGFKRTYGDDYLNSRDISDYEYELFTWGKTDQRKTQDYRFVLVEDYLSNQIGYIGRSILSKEQIKIKEQRMKDAGLNDFYYPRYKNSKDTEFSKLFFGEKEVVIGKTKEVVLVEGIFDKTNISKKLSLYNNLETKCLSTYGAKISQDQIKKLLFFGIESVILLYDPDVYSKLQGIAFHLEPFFDLKIGICPQDKDPGDLTKEEIDSVFQNLTSTINIDFVKKIV